MDRLLRISLLGLSIAGLFSCGTGSLAEGPEAPAAPAGFEARISGAYEGSVSGTGVLRFLSGAGFEKQGYFFLADGQGVRPHGVTFILPVGVGPGRHELGSPSPIEIGTVPSVRVDRDLGASVASYEENTSGYLEVEEFPDDEAGLVEGAVVAGDFEFETEDSSGRRISVTGSFSFEVE